MKKIGNQFRQKVTWTFGQEPSQVVCQQIIILCACCTICQQGGNLGLTLEWSYEDKRSGAWKGFEEAFKALYHP